jgi:pimeloyl-ACP methyl ester carboxylesterase
VVRHQFLVLAFGGSNPSAPAKQKDLLKSRSFCLAAREGFERVVQWTTPALLEIHRQKRIPPDQLSGQLDSRALSLRPHVMAIRESLSFAIIPAMKIIRNIQEIKPKHSNGLNIVYLLGYGGSIWHSKRHLRMLKNEGYTLLAMDFRDVLKNRDPQDLISVMDEVDKVLQSQGLVAPNTIILGVSMGGLIGFNMLRRHKELNKLLIITGGNMALIPKSYKQKWPISYAELEKIWEKVNIYTPPGTVKDKRITMVLPSRDKMIDPNEVTDELKRLALYNSVKVVRPKGGHFRTIITETILRPKKSLPLVTELIKK